MRWIVAGLAAACTLSAGAVYGWIASAPTPAPDWRIRDLAFLKAAHDRVQEELERQPADGAQGSLLREQQALRTAMARLARSVPPGSIPADVKPLLAPAPAAEQAARADPPPAAPARAEWITALLPRPTYEQVDAGAVAAPIDLRPGPAAARVPRLDLSEIAVHADLRLSPSRKPAGGKPAAERPRAVKTATGKAAEAAPADRVAAATPASP